MHIFNSSNSPRRRGRQIFTRYQTLELEKEFHTNHYITRRRRIEMSHQLCITERQMKVWFQNRRMKLKKENEVIKEMNEQERQTQLANGVDHGQSIHQYRGHEGHWFIWFNITVIINLSGRTIQIICSFFYLLIQLDMTKQMITVIFRQIIQWLS